MVSVHCRCSSEQDLKLVPVLVEFRGTSLNARGKEMIHFRNNERDHEQELTMKISLIPLEMGYNITWRTIQRKSLVSFPLIVSLRQ